MVKLSTSTTFLKRVVPCVLLTLLAMFMTVACFSRDVAFITQAIVFVAFGLTIGLLLLKAYAFSLLDEVYDTGNQLLLKKGKKEARINLSDIRNINYGVNPKSKKVTISINHETIFGSEVHFLAPVVFWPFTKSTSIENLIDRIDEAKRTNQKEDDNQNST